MKDFILIYINYYRLQIVIVKIRLDFISKVYLYTKNIKILKLLNNSMAYFIVHVGKLNVSFGVSNHEDQALLIDKLYSNLEARDYLIKTTFEQIIDTDESYSTNDSDITYDHSKDNKIWFEISDDVNPLANINLDQHPDERFEIVKDNLGVYNIFKNEFYSKVYEFCDYC